MFKHIEGMEEEVNAKDMYADALKRWKNRNNKVEAQEEKK